MPIDYSKWKTIEVSDDEDDTHPNIDTPSLFRWRHQARVERMAEIEEAKKEVETGKKKTLTRMQVSRVSSHHTISWEASVTAESRKSRRS